MKSWTEEVKLKFLRLAAQFDKDRITSILLHEKFPLDEALAICKEFNIPQGIALIQLKIGQYNEVGNTYITVACLQQDLEKHH